MSRILPLMVGAAGMALVFATACTPPADAGECDANRPCQDRGEVCDTVAKECVLAELDVDQTDDPDPDGNFGPIALPFFRGEVCVAKAAQPGQAVPVSISPCVHPCITSSLYKQRNQFTCSGSLCEGINLMYIEDAVGTACPADVFGRFDQGQCAYPYTVGAKQGPIVINGSNLVGRINVEIPFLSNDDAAKIVGGASSEEIWAMVKAYPSATEWVFEVTINDANAPAPADCTTDKAACNCRQIGF